MKVWLEPEDFPPTWLTHMVKQLALVVDGSLHSLATWSLHVIIGCPHHMAIVHQRTRAKWKLHILWTNVKNHIALLLPYSSHYNWPTCKRKESRLHLLREEYIRISEHFTKPSYFVKQCMSLYTLAISQSLVL